MNRVKESLTVRMIDSSFITHSIVFEITFQNQKRLFCCHILITKSIFKKFEELLSNFDKHMNHINIFDLSQLYYAIYMVYLNHGRQKILHFMKTHIFNL